MEQPPRRVVMVVGNHVASDTRVKKMALTLAHAGVETTVLGISQSGQREEFSLGPVPVILVHTNWRLREAGQSFVARARRRQARRARVVRKLRRPPPTTWQVKVASLQHQLRQREANAQVGRLRRRRDAVRGPTPVAKVRRRWLSLRIRIVKAAARRRGSRHRHWVAAAEARRRRAKSRLPRTVRGWRVAGGQFEDLELALGPELDRLQPDVIHAHDFHVIGVAERAAARAAAAGRSVAWVYDAHEFVPGMATKDPVTLDACVRLEAKYAPRADRVVTVSEPLAALLNTTHRLSRTPTVVRNVPLNAPATTFAGRTIREVIGLPSAVPLAVYSGGLTHARGVDTLVEALPHLPDLHVALVAPEGSKYLAGLMRRTEKFGVADRVHTAPYVNPEHVATYLATADVGVHPMLSDWVNHRIALPNKIFEYIHAGLPLVVSDCDTMAAWVRQCGVGEVFKSGSPLALAEALTQVLSSRETYQAGITPQLLRASSWEEEMGVLLGLYSELLDQSLAIPREFDSGLLSLGEPPRTKSCVRIASSRPRIASAQLRAALVGAGHPVEHSDSALSWVELPPPPGPVLFYDLPCLHHDPATVWVMAGPSIGRNPELHLELEPHSIFATCDVLRELTTRRHTELLRLSAEGAHVLTHSLEILDHVPEATWVPVPATVEEHTRATVPSTSNSRGTLTVGVRGTNPDAHLATVVGRSVPGVQVVHLADDAFSTDNPWRLLGIDLFVDELRTGDVTAAAIIAMSRGVPVVGNVADRVRERTQGELPVVQATPKTLAECLSSIAVRRSQTADAAERSPEFVRTFHHPSCAMEALRELISATEDPYSVILPRHRSPR